MEKINEIINITPNEEDKGKRLDVFLNEIIEEATRSYIQKLITSGNVVVNGLIPAKTGLKLKGNETINVSIPDDTMVDVTPEDLPIDIIYEDKDILVINKKPGMVVHPAFGNYSGTLVNALLYHIKDLSGINGIIRPGIVHRLDKDTSGAIIVAKNDIAHVRLSQMFKDKKIKKTYIAIVKGIFGQKSGHIETLIGRDSKNRKRMAVVEKNGKNAITEYTVLSENKNCSLVRVNILTGRTHQIRVHMRYLKHPIVGDSLYGDKDPIFTRQMLHAYMIKFEHPITSEKLLFRAELPADLIDCARHYQLDISKIQEL